ncbi:hypothetical protein Gogos_017986, partial [Gossypium gossypioides]|nr:hypothetical protein [Gossypium gossypioides]
EVVIEGDALTVVKKLQANRRDGSIISAYIEDSKSLLNEGVEYLSAWGVLDFAADAVEKDCRK